MRAVALMTLAFFVNFGCTQIKSKHITEVSQSELNAIVLVDVRTPEEFNAGHLDNALNMNWFDTDFEEQIKSISKDETIYVYCKKGGRSAKAQKKLEALGYLNVVNLEGGYDAWSEYNANH